MNFYEKGAILADCEPEEVKELAEGLSKSTGRSFCILSKICNKGRSKSYEVKRYLTYLMYPVSVFCQRNKYKYIVGWQQFFALFYAGYCKFFHVNKKNIVVAMNFTYKEKSGFKGSIYRKLMYYLVHNDYLDYIHVLSYEYAKKCANIFEIPLEKTIITGFGIPDIYDKWKDIASSNEEYTLAIGRSNRDYDFLINAWQNMSKKEKLVIISDTYKPKCVLPSNIELITNVSGDDSYPYMMNCKLMILPIDDGSICSGDTVLLQAMSFKKPVVVTEPSTLGEMYIKDGKNGFLCKKDNELFAQIIGELLNNADRRIQIGQAARESFLDEYGRKHMGEVLGNLF